MYGGMDHKCRKDVIFFARFFSEGKVRAGQGSMKDRWMGGRLHALEPLRTTGPKHNPTWGTHPKHASEHLRSVCTVKGRNVQSLSGGSYPRKSVEALMLACAGDFDFRSEVRVSR